MSRDPAPLYVRAHDLARWLLERTARWTAPPASHLGAHLAAAAQELPCAIALALTFPAERAARLRAADEALARIRELLRLARDLGCLAPRSQRYAAGEAREIGRMLGGWRRTHEHRRRLAARRAAAARPAGEGA